MADGCHFKNRLIATAAILKIEKNVELSFLFTFISHRNNLIPAIKNFFLDPLTHNN